MTAEVIFSASAIFDNPGTATKGMCAECGAPTSFIKRSTTHYRKRCDPCDVAVKKAKVSRSAATRDERHATGELVDFTCIQCGEVHKRLVSAPNRKRCIPCAKTAARIQTATLKRQERRSTNEAVRQRVRKNELKSRAKQREKLWEKRAERACGFCGMKVSPDLARYKFCGEECAKASLAQKALQERLAAHGLKAWPEKECAECGGKFLARPHGRERRFCKRSCGTKFLLREKTRRRRAMMYTLVVFDVSPREIFERDGWKCQECGVDTPADTSGQHADNEPNMDHIIPLCRGGDHHPSNLRCLCRKCNIDKGPLLDKEWRAKKRQRAKEERAMKRLAA